MAHDLQQELIRAVITDDWKRVDKLLGDGADLHRIPTGLKFPILHAVLDWAYSEERVAELLQRGADPNALGGPIDETALHTAMRRRRVEMVDVLEKAGVNLDARTSGNMTAYRHTLRRGFSECAKALQKAEADTSITVGDELALALLGKQFEKAKEILSKEPGLFIDCPWEEARLLPDVAAWGNTEAVRILLDAGVQIDTRGLDQGGAMHQAAWFGQPETASLLIERGATLNLRGDAHDATPLAWAAHGSRYSGGADERQEDYVAITRMLLKAGAPLPQPRDAYDHPQFRDASEPVREILIKFGWKP